MTLFIGSLTIGLILSLLALGVYISFRIFDIADMTADGSLTLGASICAVCLVKGFDPITATAAGIMGGLIAGTVTGLLHTKLNIHGLLSGILVMTALYSVNLKVMGKSNIPLLNENSLANWTENFGILLAGKNVLMIFGWEVPVRDAAMLIAAVLIVLIMALLIYIFFRTHIGTAMRATGNNQQMIRALGVNTGNMIVIGLAVSNGLIAFAGALLAQYQGFADVQMGIGILVFGLASVIIGEALVGRDNLLLTVAGAVIGSILFRLLVAIALRWGMDPNNLKLVTAVFVLAALVVPGLLDKYLSRKGSVKHA
jgi:putative ABC transport system permease protein